MSADKRSVHTDALKTLGTLELDNTAGRDAIHLAVEPVTCDEIVYPCQHVGYLNGKAMPKEKPVGIVDPFLTSPVQPGAKFWLVVYPRTITSLRHVWEHPEFEHKDLRSAFEKSQQWLMDYADSIDESYENVMSVADSHQDKNNYGDYIIQGGRFEGETTPDEFWDHYAIVRGVSTPVRASFFSCSC